MTRPDRDPDAAPDLLAGMQVLSFCHFLQGPAATQYLADMGPAVLKVEPPRRAGARPWPAAAAVATVITLASVFATTAPAPAAARSAAEAAVTQAPG